MMFFFTKIRWNCCYCMNWQQVFELAISISAFRINQVVCVQVHNIIIGEILLKKTYEFLTCCVCDVQNHENIFFLSLFTTILMLNSWKHFRFCFELKINITIFVLFGYILLSRRKLPIDFQNFLNAHAIFWINRKKNFFKYSFIKEYRRKYK